METYSQDYSSWSYSHSQWHRHIHYKWRT